MAPKPTTPLEFACRRCARLVVTTTQVAAAEEEALRAHLEREHGEIRGPNTMSLGELLSYFEVRGQGLSRYRRRKGG
jgi:hypothetical protein